MYRLLVLVMVLGCGNKAADCKLEAEELYTLLKTTPHQGSPFYAQKGVTLAKRADLAGTSMPYAPVVTVNADTITFEGTLVSDASQLADAAKHARDNARRMRDRANTKIYFQIDRATPWKIVVELSRAVEDAGFTSIGYAFSTGAKLTPPPRSPIDDKLDALMADRDSSNNATKLAGMVKDVISGCGGLEKAFSRVGSEESDDKADVLIEGTKEGLIECNCKVDIPQLRSLLWRVMSVDPDIQVVSYTSISGKGGKGDQVAAAGTATWGDVAARLPKGGSVELVAN